MKPILIITYTINIISPQPLHHSNTSNWIGLIKRTFDK